MKILASCLVVATMSIGIVKAQSDSATFVSEGNEYSFTGYITDEGCGFPILNGAIDIQMSPSGNYTFLWSSGETTEDLTGIAAGNYSVVVTSLPDSVVTTGYFSVSQDGSDPIVLVDQADVSCAGANDGFIELDAPTGATYVWEDNSTNPRRENLAPGWYSVQYVLAPNFCMSYQWFQIQSPDSLQQSLVRTEKNCSNLTPASGLIEIAISGGTPPYSIAWDNGSMSTLNEGLVAGNYFVTITDANNCTDTATYTVVDSICGVNNVSISVPQLVTNNGDGFNDVLFIENIEAFAENRLTILNRYGGVVFEASPYTNNFDGTLLNTGTPLPDGTYFYRLELNDATERELNGFIVIRQ